MLPNNLSSQIFPQKGFTLLEVVVALMIFSISLLAITRALGQGARALVHVQEKTYAHWVARNATASLLLGSQGNLAVGAQSSGTMEMGHQTYAWQAKIMDTHDPYIWKIAVDVQAENQKNTLANLTTYTRAHLYE